LKPLYFDIEDGHVHVDDEKYEIAWDEDFLRKMI
jgi:hypothetical protein